MIRPWESADAFFSTIPLLETVTALNAGASISTPFIDTVDLIRSGHSSPEFGPVGAINYTVNPLIADPRFFLYYTILAQTGAPGAVPGQLRITGAVIDPATGLQSATSFRHTTIPYEGPAISFDQTSLSAINEITAATHGRIAIKSRFIQVDYLNGNIGMTVFQLGVYLRAL